MYGNEWQVSPNLQRIALIGISLLGLALVYLTQQFNYADLIINSSQKPALAFVVNRTIRFILNDLLAILLIWAIFRNSTYVKVAFVVQLFGLLIVLPIYFVLKLQLEGPTEISSPLLSFLHRIIINPVMILLLIPAFFLQNQKKITE